MTRRRFLSLFAAPFVPAVPRAARPLPQPFVIRASELKIPLLRPDEVLHFMSPESQSARVRIVGKTK
jgi:hypothetical protein